MTRDRSLDDFLSGRSDGDDDDDESDDGDDADGRPAESSNAARDATEAEAEPAAATRTADAVEPAVGTYRWDPDGVACADCGETVERLWLDDGEQVCADCKEW